MSTVSCTYSSIRSMESAAIFYSIANTGDNEVVRINTLRDFTPTVNTSLDFFMRLYAARTVNELPSAKTELGKILLQNRKKISSNGTKLLTADEINLMVKEGRGDCS